LTVLQKSAMLAYAPLTHYYENSFESLEKICKMATI
jgi:hypothetical protein